MTRVKQNGNEWKRTETDGNECKWMATDGNGWKYADRDMIFEESEGKKGNLCLIGRCEC